MKVIVAEPPLIDEIRARFNPGRGVIYAYGDTIFNPYGVLIASMLFAHEEEHGRQQQFVGVDIWWRRYLDDAEFRYREEVKGHAAEFLAAGKRDRNQDAALLVSTTCRLISPLYAYGEHRPPFKTAMHDLKVAIGRRA